MDDSFSIYKIAFPWYPLIGGLIVILVGAPLSHLIGPQDSIKTLNPNLISPIAQCLIPKRFRHKEIHLSRKDLQLSDDEKNMHIKS